MKHLATLLLLLLTAASTASAQSDPDVYEEVAAATRVKKGEQAPDFTCKTTDGRQITLSQLKGKVVVLYFYAASAPASLTEMKYLEKAVHQKLRERQDLVILGIGRGHTREEVVAHGGKYGLTFQLAADPDQAAYRKYFSAFVPRMVVLRKDGQICHLQSGSREFNGVLELLTVLERELKRPAEL
jgi:peroxiredoxin